MTRKTVLSVTVWPQFAMQILNGGTDPLISASRAHYTGLVYKYSVVLGLLGCFCQMAFDYVQLFLYTSVTNHAMVMAY